MFGRGGLAPIAGGDDGRRWLASWRRPAELLALAARPARRLQTAAASGWRWPAGRQRLALAGRPARRLQTADCSGVERCIRSALPPGAMDPLGTGPLQK